MKRDFPPQVWFFPTSLRNNNSPGVAAAMLHVCFGLGANNPGFCHGGLSSAGIQLSGCRMSWRQFVKNLTY